MVTHFMSGRNGAAVPHGMYQRDCVSEEYGSSKIEQLASVEIVIELRTLITLQDCIPSRATST